MTDLARFTRLLDDLGLEYTTREVSIDRTIEITMERGNRWVMFVFGFDHSFRFMCVEG